MEDSCIVKKVQEGMQRLDDEYARSAIDWLQVHRGVACTENSFSVVAWWRLKLEEEEFAWGKLECTSPVEVKPDFVFLLQDMQAEGGLNVCLQLPDAEFEQFSRLIMENES
ncbi:Rosmarinate synthase [Euphorbia peplus]|nr:Rosmarinate synthase [Euphorbia peplus]